MRAYLQMILAEFGRNRMRVGLTLASIAVAFLLFGLLDAVRTSFVAAGESEQGARRLITSSRVPLGLLPQALESQIASLDEVEAIAHAAWFGGYYQDPEHQLAAYAVSDSYFDVYSEIEIDPWARRAFQNTRNAIVVGENVARRFKWKTGQSVPMFSNIFFDRQGSNNWNFEIVGIVRTSEPEKAAFYGNVLLLRLDFLLESSPYGQGWVGWYVSNLRDASQSAHVANLIDRLSLNSAYETMTITEQASLAAQIRQWADLDLITRSIMGAVLFSLLFLIASVMAYSVRERRAELAVLQALGFSRRRIGSLIVGESMLLLMTGGILGLVLAAVCALVANSLIGDIVRLSAFNPKRWGMGGVLMLGLGLVVGMLPVLWHARLNVASVLSSKQSG